MDRRIEWVDVMLDDSGRRSDPNEVTLSPPSAALRRLRVLVLDDDLATLKSVPRVLGADYEVTTVRSLSDLLALLLVGRRFDAILSDVWMPEVEGDGMHVDARVRKVSPQQAERIVFMTSGGLPDRLARFIADRIVVTKPIELGEVRAAIDRVAALSRESASRSPR